MKSLSVRITCLLDVSIGTLNGLHINRIVSQNYPISLSTYIDFPSYTLITTSNSKECPKTYNVYVSSIGDIALTTSGTYALINSPSFQLVGSQLLINEGLPIQ